MSLLLLPLATTFALEFTTPAWALMLAVPVLGERLTASRVGAVVLGLLGVLVILRPGLATFQPAVLLILTAAVGFAIALIATKKLTRMDSTFTIIFWMNAIQLPLALVASDPLFVTKLGPGQVPAVIAMGLSGLASHYCLTNAFQAGDAGVVVPLDFLRIPLIAMIGWWLYNEALDAFVFIGAGLIIAGVLWNLQSEAWRTVAPSTGPAGSAAKPPARRPALTLGSDQVDLDQRIRNQQSRAADGGARRRLLEVALPHRVEAVEVVEVGEKHLRLDHLVQR